MSIRRSKFITVFERNKTGLLFAVFVLVHIVLLLSVGIQTGLEAEKYISEGTRLYHGNGFSEGKYVFYAPVILLVWLCKSLHISILWIVLFQVALSAISQYFFYRMIEKIVGSRKAFICSLLLVAFIPYQIWNLFLYSDSIFFSLCLLLTYAIFLSTEKKGKYAMLFTMPVLLLVLFSRPGGMFLTVPFCLFFILIAKTWTVRILNGFLTITLLAATYAGTNYIFRNSSDMNVLIPYIEEHIICFVPTNNAENSLQLIQTGNSVHDLWYYITNNPSHFVKMVLLRLKSVFSLHRPYYGTMHNIYLIVFTAFIYITGVWGIRSLIRLKVPIRKYLMGLLILYPISIAIQCDDWHSRFVMIIFPYLCLLSVLGTSKLIVKLSPSQ